MTDKKTEEKDTYIVQGYEIKTKVVGTSGGISGRIYLPESWVGKKVKVIRIN